MSYVLMFFALVGAVPFSSTHTYSNEDACLTAAAAQEAKIREVYVGTYPKVAWTCNPLRK